MMSNWKAILCICVISMMLLCAARSACLAGQGDGKQSRPESSGYFRFEVTLTPQTAAEEARTKIVIETYDLSELPKVPDLDEHQDIRREISSYLKQGFKYIKLEVTTVGGKKSRKVELYRERERTKD